VWADEFIVKAIGHWTQCPGELSLLLSLGIMSTDFCADLREGPKKLNEQITAKILLKIATIPNT